MFVYGSIVKDYLILDFTKYKKIFPICV